MSKYLNEAAGAFSKLLNALVTGNRNQTFSAHAYEAAVIKKKPYWPLVMRAIDAAFWSVKHALLLCGVMSANAMPEFHCEDSFFHMVD